MWFWHVLALALGGCTVAELQGRMSLAEFHRWQQFYEMQPFDDVHRFYRPAALSAHVAGGGDFGELMDTLLNRQKPQESEQDMAAVNTFRAFGLDVPPQFLKE